ncbi:MAG TPA: hypothetical protein P5342_00840 [Candidatus Cloacimonadota bacterium]|nr:hypothetical protein [Candidatus Cloacimonadota bacterium]
MKRYLILTLSLLLLLLASCDRFEHSFAPPTQTDFEADFFNPLQTAFNIISAGNLSAIEAMYSQDYLHNGLNRADRLAWIESFLDESQVSFEVLDPEASSIDESNAVANWRLRISSGSSVLADSSFVGENLQQVDGHWLLKGNSVCIQNPMKQLVIAEYFTFRTCPNCPPAEAKLQALQAMYPNNFIYLEHHVTMELALPEDQTYMYYQAWSQPSAVFQGMDKVNESSDQSLAQYQSIVDSYTQIDEPIDYEVISLLPEGNEVIGNVKLTPKTDIDFSDVVLNYVIISDEYEYTNYAGNPLHNVVRAKYSHSLAGVDLSQPIPFSFSTSEDLPEFYTLVIFAQKKPAVFQNNATIYGGVQVNIIPSMPTRS